MDHFFCFKVENFTVGKRFDFLLALINFEISIFNLCNIFNFFLYLYKIIEVSYGKTKNSPPQIMFSTIK